MPEATPKNRRHSRRWGRIILILALLLAAGYSGYRYLLLPRVRLVTARVLPPDTSIHFSARGPGYPAIQETAPPRGETEGDAEWLSDDCRALGNPFEYDSVFNPVGLKRDRVIGRYLRYRRPGYTVHGGLLALRDGRRFKLGEKVTLPPELLATKLRSNEPMQYPPWYFAGDDPDCYPYWQQKTDRLGVYDRKARRTLFTCRLDYREETGAVFHRDARFLVVPRVGRAFLYEGGKRTDAFGTKQTTWCWGEDGTVWMIDAGVVRLLQWHAASPRLVRLSGRTAIDPRIGYLGNRTRGGIFNGMGEPPPPRNTWDPDPSAAVWGDGRLVVRTETVSRWPRQLEPLVRKFAPGAMQEMRRLTLYWHGRRIARKSVVLDTSVTPRKKAVYYHGGSRVQLVYSREHLAFTGDGKYLSWTIDTTKGTTVYAFRINPPAVRLGRFP